MVEDINMLLERLNFSEEESIRFFSLNMSSTNVKGYEAWAVGKIMFDERLTEIQCIMFLNLFRLQRN